MTLEMRNIYKSFGANDVLQDVTFGVKGGEICALLGENGAGKSTLMNILGGVLECDKGGVFLDGKEVHFKKPAQSLGAGIAFIHQELNLVNDLAVYENMFIGREIKKKSGFLDSKAMCEACRQVFARMDVDLDPRAMVRDLDASYKQIVEIARALLMEASIIIMDEPTTSLTEPEVERVFEMMRTLRDQQVAIVFISHKLKEVMEICSHYNVLRDGKMVASGEISDTNIDELAKHMVGHEVKAQALKEKRELGKPVLTVSNLSQENAFQDISFEVKAGEIVGFTGLLGDGRSELFQAIFGCGGKYKGTVSLEGNPVHLHSTLQAVKQGIGYVPRNRKENGIIKDMSILENGSIVTWGQTSRFGFLDHTKIADAFHQQKERLRIKMEKDKDAIGSLSGGNQQKVVLAKWLSAHPKVLIFDNPTQGVDVGAKEDIYETILELAKQGMAIVILSSEAQEIIRLCSRAYVMFHGKIQGELPEEEMTEQEIMRLATGGEMKERAAG